MGSESIPPRISVREIAKQMGLSHATVSMALRGSPRVSPQTGAEVRRYAEMIGYRPDPMLGALAHYRQSKAGGAMKAAIAWVNAWENPDRLRSYREFDGYWNGAKAEAEKSGYRLEEFRVGRECSPEHLHRILEARGICGLLLPPHLIQPDWGKFPWGNYSVVKLGRSLSLPTAHLVTSDQMANAMLAYRSIRHRGYRRIGFATEQLEFLPPNHLFGAGWLLAQKLMPVEERIPSFEFLRHQRNQHAELFGKWLDEFRPEAILTDFPGIPQLLDILGIRVPGDVGLAGTTIRDLEVDSGIDQHPEEIGRTAFLMLNGLINEGIKGEPKLRRQLLVQGDWVDGTSLPAKNR